MGEDQQFRNVRAFHNTNHIHTGILCRLLPVTNLYLLRRQAEPLRSFSKCYYTSRPLTSAMEDIMPSGKIKAYEEKVIH